MDQNWDTALADGDELDRHEKAGEISVSQQQEDAAMDEVENMSGHTLVEEHKPSEPEDGNSGDTLAEKRSIEEKEKFLDYIKGRDDAVMGDESSGIGENIDCGEGIC